MTVTPGFSATATLKAFLTTSVILSAERIDWDHLEIGRIIATESMFWWLSLCRRLVDPCPMIATTGARSMFASASPVTKLVAPGPRVARQTPAFPVRRP